MTRPTSKPKRGNSLAASAAVRRHSSRRVQEAELVDGDEGWVRTGGGLFWTTDGGRSWRPITPPVPEARLLRGVYFGDQRRGWALAEEGHEGATRPVFFSTRDGGRGWRTTPVQIPEMPLGAASVSFAPSGESGVFALVKESGDTASNQGFLLRSGDGGRTWRELPRPPQSGEISFDSARRGWLAGRYPAPRLWRTDDGGRTWTELHLDPPPHQEAENVSYLPPRIGRDGHGLLAAVFVARNSRQTTATVYATADSGRHWHLTEAKHLPHSGGWLEAGQALAFRGPHSVLIHEPLATRTTVAGGGGAVSSFVARGLPDWSRQIFSGPRYGFAVATFGEQPGLTFSDDRGRSWTPVSPPLPPRSPE